MKMDRYLVLKTTALYLLLASIWIISSDSVLKWFVPDLDTYMRLQTYKGWAFVLVTGTLLYTYLKPRIRELKESQEQLIDAERLLRDRLAYELATVECMRFLLEAENVEDTLSRILKVLHKAVDNSRSYIFRNVDDPKFGLCMSQIYEVVADGIEPQIDNPDLKLLPYTEGAQSLYPLLLSRQHYAHIVEDLQEPDRTILAEQGIISILILPIYVGQQLWGFVGFDDCQKARGWKEDDINLLRVVADGIGEAIFRQQAKNELKESEERFKTLHDASFGGIVIHDKGTIIDCNKGLSKVTGYPNNELIGMQGLLLIAEDYRSMVLNKMSSGNEEPYDIMGKRKNGTTYPARIQAKNIPYKGRKARVVELRDITEQKQSEEALRKNEAKQSAMIANIADVIAIVDKDWNIMFKSPNIEKWFGWKAEEIIGTPLWENIHPDDLKRTQEIFTAIIERKKATVTSEARYLCKDGSYKWIEYTGTNLQEETSIRGILLNYHDITERKQAEDALKENEGKFRNYIENAPHGIFIIDEHGNCLEVNKTASIITGYQEIELIGSNTIDIVAPDSRNRARHCYHEVKHKGFASTELLCIQKNGKEFWMKMDAAKLSETIFIIFASDITDKKNVEYSLVQAKMLAEENSRIKSEFLANMSHELRTPLTAIIGFSDLLSTGMFGDLNEKQLEYVNHINKGGTHLLDVINDVLDLSKLEAGKMELDCVKFPLSEVFDELRTYMSPLADKKDIKMEIVNNTGTNEIFADRLKFKQILFNLLSNAIKFTPQRGNISVIASRTNDHVHISVSDTGIGIPAHMLQDIFSPFTQVDASNKRKYGGTGLGLTLVKQFVEMHDGNISVRSEEGTGSTFTFTIGKQNQLTIE